MCLFLFIIFFMIYVVMGPTGSGKTDAANRIAEFLKCPIINADAFQIYKDMNIGTAKLDCSDPAYSSYHLLDIVTPEESFSVKQFQDIFRKTLDDLLINNANVVVCGGTGLYIRAAFYDYNFEVCESYDTSKYDSLSNDELWELLQKLDLEACKNIHPNNRKRVIRAISIAENNKHTKSENIKLQDHTLIYDDVEFLFINLNREILYEKINVRVDEMIKQGLVEEVKNLINKYDLSLTSRQAIGYKEIIAYLKGELTLLEATDLIKQRTRNYAKRQVTFFKHQFKTKEFSNKDELVKWVISHE